MNWYGWVIVGVAGWVLLCGLVLIPGWARFRRNGVR